MSSQVESLRFDDGHISDTDLFRLLRQLLVFASSEENEQECLAVNQPASLFEASSVDLDRSLLTEAQLRSCI